MKREPLGGWWERRGIARRLGVRAGRAPARRVTSSCAFDTWASHFLINPTLIDRAAGESNRPLAVHPFSYTRAPTDFHTAKRPAKEIARARDPPSRAVVGNKGARLSCGPREKRPFI